MNRKIEEIRYLSSDGEHKIYAKFYTPISEEIKGVIQISHGMNGYIGKYDDIAQKFMECGYAVCGNTHLGHEGTANTQSELGFFGEFNGYKYLVRDVQKLTQIAKEKYKGKNIFLFGHSMGSLIVRCGLPEIEECVKGVILSGTIGPNMLVDSGIQLADGMIQRKGYRFRSRKLYQLLFNAANRRIEDATSNYDWVTSRKEFLQGREQDFLFTVTGLRDVLNLIKESNDSKYINKINKDLPLYFFAGSEDPVGSYGEGVRKAVALYEKAGIKDVTCKIYEGDRHECFNEEDAEEVVDAIVQWIEKHNKG